MKRNIIVIIFIFIFTVFQSCSGSSRPAMLFFAEDYWWDILLTNPQFEDHLRKTAGGFGMDLDVVIGIKEKNYAETLRDTASLRLYEEIVVSPLMTLDVIRMAPQFPATRFLVLGAPNLDLPFPVNVIPVRRKSYEGYRDAGKAAAYLLSNSNNQSFGSRVGIITEEKNMDEKDMVTAFEQGFSEFGVPAMIAKEVITQSNDRVRAGQSVENLSAQEVKIFFVKASMLTIACVEKIIAIGGYFIIEDFPYFNMNSDRLVGSIQDDPTESIKTALEELKEMKSFPNDYEIKALSSEFVPGKIYLDTKTLNEKVK